jgi:prepilin-type N-terminal cleavage/methylation domain-containing protein
MRSLVDRRRAGFTLIEAMVVVGIIAIFAALAVPSWRQYQRNLQLRSAARSVSNAYAYARSHALSTGNRHMVVFAVDPGNPNDACGNAIVDAQGNPVPMLVYEDLDDNCCLDVATELRLSERAVPGVSWGVTPAPPAGPAASPEDAGAGDYSTGSSFAEPGGGDAAWVAFGPDGIPQSFDAACNLGTTGTGAGAIYLTNGLRNYAVVLNPLGTGNVERFDSVTNAWEN